MKTFDGLEAEFDICSEEAALTSIAVSLKRIADVIAPTKVDRKMAEAQRILDAKMLMNDANANTIRDYLKALLLKVWEEGEGFSGKRPFGNSGWQCELQEALVAAGLIKGELDEEGRFDSCDEAAADHAIRAAINALQ